MITTSWEGDTDKSGGQSNEVIASPLVRGNLNEIAEFIPSETIEHACNDIATQSLYVCFKQG